MATSVQTVRQVATARRVYADGVESDIHVYDLSDQLRDAESDLAVARLEATAAESALAENHAARRQAVALGNEVRIGQLDRLRATLSAAKRDADDDVLRAERLVDQLHADLDSAEEEREVQLAAARAAREALQ